MALRLLIEQHIVFLGLKGGCVGSSESIDVKMPHCWKSHVVAHFQMCGVEWSEKMPNICIMLTHSGHFGKQ